MRRALLNRLRQLAGDRCDYCRLPSAFDPLPFQVDHIIAEQHGGETHLTVNATDSGEIASTTLLINGTPVTLDANGMATLSSPTPGVFTVEAIVLDNDGNEGVATTEFRVLTTGDTTLPTVAVSLPDDGAEVTLPTDIIGTADDADLQRYVLELSEAGKNDFRVFASGMTPVINWVLGQFDPTLLLNGIYDVWLTAKDTSGNVASVTQSYEVDGGAKIGNFTLSFNDLTIPVSGIPITITRTYDSRKRSQGDFGAGWTFRHQEYRPPGKHGKRTEFTHDIAARREEILDRLGNTTVHEDDKRGNITATISPRSHWTEFTYEGSADYMAPTWVHLLPRHPVNPSTNARPSLRPE